MLPNPAFGPWKLDHVTTLVAEYGRKREANRNPAYFPHADNVLVPDRWRRKNTPRTRVGFRVGLDRGFRSTINVPDVRIASGDRVRVVLENGYTWPDTRGLHTYVGVYRGCCAAGLR
jgi:hypothetical protein